MASSVTEESGQRVANQIDKPLKRLIFATSIGNALEWFDFAAYGFLPSRFRSCFFQRTMKRCRCC